MTCKYEKENRINVSSVLSKPDLLYSGYSSYKKRLNHPSPQNQGKVSIKQRILSIYYESGEINGAPKICGHIISEKTVGNYMLEMGLKACYIKPYTVTTIDPDFDSNLRNLLSN